jgi:hypothetical protein
MAIHIKPENKGKFNATKKATGKSTEELTHSKNPITKKRAIFAQNAAKWKHTYGGLVNPFEDGGGLQTASSITSGIGQAASGIPVVGGIIGGVLQGASSIMGAFGAKKQQEAAIEEQKKQELQQKMLSMPTAQGGVVPGVVNPYMFALGGYMGGKHDPINFLTKYQTGGTHEQNPLGGIPLGMGINGKQNVVEQGEASFNFKDGKYIFSNRLKIR